MATDYILFIHGVNTRERRPQPEYANSLFELLYQKNASDPKRELKKIAIYWGNVNEKAENELLKNLQDSPYWSQMWFKAFREKQILQFAGDAALYISSYIGSLVVQQLKAQALQNGLNNPQPDDRLHLVTHSWGTVILFDILFADRWDNENVPGHADVMQIRDAIFGVSGKDHNTLYQGIKLASIHTMGSPVAIFSLTNIRAGKDETNSPSSHDITPKLQQLLESLSKERNGQKLPWRNFIHPGDPIAYPLESLMSNLVDGDKKFLDIQDVITHQPGPLELLIEQSAVALLFGGDAHGSYWRSNKVAQLISDIVTKN
jgi:hypothetical protein